MNGKRLQLYLRETRIKMREENQGRIGVPNRKNKWRWWELQKVEVFTFREIESIRMILRRTGEWDICVLFQLKKNGKRKEKCVPYFVFVCFQNKLEPNSLEIGKTAPQFLKILSMLYPKNFSPLIHCVGVYLSISDKLT